MKTKRILHIAIALVTLTSLSSFLPDNNTDWQKFFQRSPETRANMITMVMKNSLDLSEEQVEKAYRINLKYAQLNQPYLKNKDNLHEVSDKIEELNNNRKDELKNILTPAQIKKAEDIRLQWIRRLEIILNRLKENDFTNQ
jgi:hypothetical protein